MTDDRRDAPDVYEKWRKLVRLEEEHHKLAVEHARFNAYRLHFQELALRDVRRMKINGYGAIQNIEEKLRESRGAKAHCPVPAVRR